MITCGRHLTMTNDHRIRYFMLLPNSVIQHHSLAKMLSKLCFSKDSKWKNGTFHLQRTYWLNSEDTNLYQRESIPHDKPMVDPFFPSSLETMVVQVTYVSSKADDSCIKNHQYLSRLSSWEGNSDDYCLFFVINIIITF